MADDPKPDPVDDPKPDADELGDKGKKALDSERKARREAEKKAQDLEARLKELEDKDKSDSEKLRGEVAELTKQRDDATATVLRLEVAAEKGVKPRWLNGSTREELEAAADEYLADHPPADPKPTPPGGAPKENLRPGAAPTEPEPTKDDIRKAIAEIPR